MLERPSQMRTNAWTGEETPIFDFPAGTIPDLASLLHLPFKVLAPPHLPKAWDWRSPDVGWGVILCDDPGRSPAEKAAAADAPKSIRRLLAARAPAGAALAPILRYQPNKPKGQLCRYFSDGGHEMLSTSAPDRGVRTGQIPQYLLIYGSPAKIPWAVQFGLNASAFVGRLDLGTDEGLEHYVDALITDWAAHARCKARKPVIWSADWGQPDVTSMMARIVGGKLAAKFAADTDFGERLWLTGPQATRTALGEALNSQRPGFICTTSHGMTGPLADSLATKAQLGSPVDTFRNVVRPVDIGGWQPGGAIWYSHACCSAGSDSVSRYADLISATQRGGQMLRQIAATAGSRVAPLPRALLGALNPLGAFVGHVEPTFDWTLREPINHQELTHTIVRCLYDRLFTAEHPAPIGWAIADLFAEAASFLSLADAPGETDARPMMKIYNQLAGIDRQNIVILGDPTVTLRPYAERVMINSNRWGETDGNRCFPARNHGLQSRNPIG